MGDDEKFSRDLAPLGLLVLNHASKQTTSALNLTRAYVSANLKPGEKIAAIDPRTGEALGHVTRKVDEKVVTLVDESEFMAHLQTTNPDALFDGLRLKVTTSNQDIVSVLAEHAPHLVEEFVGIHDWAVNQAFNEAKGGTPVPGVQVSTRPGSTAIYQDKAAGDAIEALLRAGVVGLDGTVHPTIEGEVSE